MTFAMEVLSNEHLSYFNPTELKEGNLTNIPKGEVASNN